MVKSKSMLTEECEMNPYLERHGIDVVETDLGERILQLMHQKPSHIVMPAIHIKQEEVGRLFEKELGSEPGNYDPTYLTYQARLSLRDEFLTADAGMTGANFGVAETGEIVVCTNEGNADMATSVPKLHIAAMGLEKVIPDRRSLAVFQRLLCRSATGQPTTTYTSHFAKARPGGEMHIILVDNGRTDILADGEHWQTLKCIRCGACMNTCPVYRRSGGYSYTYFIPGPIGINLGMGHSPSLYADNVSACSLCCSCDNVCPAKVNLSEQIYLWRQKLDSLGKANQEKEMDEPRHEGHLRQPRALQHGAEVRPAGKPRPALCRLQQPQRLGQGPRTARVCQGIVPNNVEERKSEMSNKEDILAKIRAAKRESYPMPDLDSLRPNTYQAPAEEFIKACAATGASVIEAKPGESLDELVLRSYPGAKAIASNVEGLSAATKNPDTVAEAQELNGTDVGVVRGEIGVAENGCVWIPQTMEGAGSVLHFRATRDTARPPQHRKQHARSLHPHRPGQLRLWLLHQRPVKDCRHSPGSRHGRTGRQGSHRGAAVRPRPAVRLPIDRRTAGI